MEDRGVSGEMRRYKTVNERIPFLLLHGVLHLMGHDHETDEEFEVMAEIEERLIKELKQRMEARGLMNLSIQE